MKILILGSRIPYPLSDGGAIASYNMLREMAARGAEITFFSFNTKKHFVADEVIRKEFPFCRVIWHYLDSEVSWYKALLSLIKGENYNLSRFINKGANNKLNSLLRQENFDIVQFEGLYATPFLETVLSVVPRSSLVLRQHNVEYEIWQRLSVQTSNPVKKWYLNYLAKGLEKWERAMLKNIPVILAITQSDARKFREISPEASVLYYPAGFTIPDPEDTKPEELSLYHIGSMEWMPNIEGVKWFCREILPGVLEKYPEARLHLAGKGLDKTGSEFRYRGVVNHGEVENAIDFHSKYQIMIVPLKSGSGLRMKILESMALKKTVISTSTGAEGIPGNPGMHLLLANTQKEWVEKICFCFENPEKVIQMGIEARKLVSSEFSLERHTRSLLSQYEAIKGNKT